MRNNGTREYVVEYTFASRPFHDLNPEAVMVQESEAYTAEDAIVRLKTAQPYANIIDVYPAGCRGCGSMTLLTYLSRLK